MESRISRKLTSNIPFVAVVDLFKAPVTKGQLAHPVHSALYCWIRALPSCPTRSIEPVVRKVIVAGGGGEC